MSNEDRSCHVTFNGEIYNYVELRDELKARGHKFRSHSDTEVIVHAYEEWGEDCPNKLRGMFAFAIIDERRRKLFVARDRLGIKPLLFATFPNQTIVASEMGPIKKLAPNRLEVNPEAIHAFLRLGYIPAPLTIYKEVFKLPPARSMTFSATDPRPVIREYWKLAFQPDYQLNESDWLDRLDETIRDAVRLHTRSDVDFGAFLSGGLDSSLVVSYMAEVLDRPVRTFAMGFEEEGFSECHYAKTASELYSTNHRTHTVSQADLSALSEIVTRYGEPFGDHSAIPTMKLCEFAANDVKMVLSGDGGDELFGGYERYVQAAEIWSGEAPSRAQRALGTVKAKVKQLLKRASYSPPSALEYWLQNSRMFTSAELQEIAGKGAADPVTNLIASSVSDSKEWRYLSQLQYLDLGCYLPGDILPKVDIASMTYGLEVRVPLLDHYVAECAAQIPPEYLITHDQHGAWTGKSILKKLALRKFPQDFVYRKKQGFGIPIAQWVGGTKTGELHETLLGSSSHLTQYLDKAAVAQLIDGENVPMRSRKLWLLLVLQMWLKETEGV